MFYIVYYKTQKRLMHKTCESPKEMWTAIHKALDKGYTVTEVHLYDFCVHNIYTLHFDLQGEPQLRKFR